MIHAGSDGAGEVCISGPHVSPGHWSGRERKIVAYPGLLIDDAGRTYIRTGDLGEIVDGELYLRGRIKDVVIVNGRKIHAVDIEATALGLSDDFAIAAVAAVGIEEEQGDSVILLCEIDDKSADSAAIVAFKERLLRQIGEEHGIRPVVECLKPHALPRTSSGKVQRYACRQKYRDGDFEAHYLR